MISNRTQDSKHTNILNLFMLGTDENIDGVRTVLTETYNSIAFSPTQSKYLINGVGGLPENNKTSKHPLLGTYNCKVTYEKTGEITAEKTLRGGMYKNLHRLKGLVKAVGYKDAYTEAESVIEAMVKAGKRPLRINMYGFSRGADTLLRLCNRLNSKYPNGVEINLLAIDQAPGPLRNNAKKSRRVPSIVKSLKNVYMKHERRPAYAVQDKNALLIEDLNKTEVDTDILSGSHAFSQRFRPGGADASRILWEITHRFAEANGTKLQSTIPYVTKHHNEYLTYNGQTRLTDEEYLNCYTRMINNEKFYSKTGPRILKRRFVKRQRDYFLHGHGVFQDLTHVKLFKKLYPNFFNYFFEQNINNVALSAVNADIEKIKKNKLLFRYIKKFIPGLFSFKPGGIFLSVNDFYRRDNKLRILWESIQSVLFTVIGGYSNDISVKRAEEILDEIHALLISKESDDKKILQIYDKLREIIADHQDTLIAKKLTLFLPERQNFSHCVDDAMKIFRNYSEELLLVKDERKAKIVSIVKTTMAYLEVLKNLGAGTDPSAVRRILINAELAIRHIARKHPLIKAIKNYNFNLGVNIENDNPNSHDIDHQVNVYRECLQDIIDPKIRFSNRSLVNKYKVELYRKLHNLMQVTQLMSENDVKSDIITHYKKLYLRLSTDIQKSKATSATYDPIPVVIDHFIHLGEGIAKRKAITSDDMTRSMTRLDKKLKDKKPMSPELKMTICGVIGAIVGFSIGLVVVGLATGGFGALPGAIVGAVSGFTLTTAGGISGAGLTSLIAAGLGLFHNETHRQDYYKMKNSLVNKDLKDFALKADEELKAMVDKTSASPKKSMG